MWLNSGSLIEREYDIFRSNEAVIVSDGDFGGSRTMASIETPVFNNNLKLKSSWITRWT
jgi:hypothetical protein